MMPPTQPYFSSSLLSSTPSTVDWSSFPTRSSSSSPSFLLSSSSSSSSSSLPSLLTPQLSAQKKRKREEGISIEDLFFDYAYARTDITTTVKPASEETSGGIGRLKITPTTQATSTQLTSSTSSSSTSSSSPHLACIIASLCFLSAHALRSHAAPSEENRTSTPQDATLREIRRALGRDQTSNRLLPSPLPLLRMPTIIVPSGSTTVDITGITSSEERVTTSSLLLAGPSSSKTPGDPYEVEMESEPGSTS